MSKRRNNMNSLFCVLISSYLYFFLYTHYFLATLSSPSTSLFLHPHNNNSFRRITYYPDRPDNMAIFDSVRIEANKALYPVLLSNGNKFDEGIITNDNDNNERHYATWSDPYPKPSYLFCIVAGNLKSVSSSYTTRPSGRKVHLNVYSEPENVSKLGHALTSLKKSMKWDEDTFGLEYDLDIYNIVAVSEFNMGAMEVRVFVCV